MRISPIILFQRTLAGFVLAVVVCGAWWLATGEVPGLGELLVTQFLLSCSISCFACARRIREEQVLREMYDSPSAEEKK